MSWFMRHVYSPVLLRAPVKLLVMLCFFGLLLLCVSFGYHHTEVSVKASEMRREKSDVNVCWGFLLGVHLFTLSHHCLNR